LGSLKAHCDAHLGPALVPAHFVAADRLPRNDMGKIDRQQLAESLRKAAAARA